MPQYFCACVLQDHGNILGGNPSSTDKLEMKTTFVSDNTFKMIKHPKFNNILYIAW